MEDGHTVGDGVLTEGNLAQKKIPQEFDDVEAAMQISANLIDTIEMEYKNE